MFVLAIERVSSKFSDVIEYRVVQLILDNVH